jgi:hypothetical protein
MVEEDKSLLICLQEEGWRNIMNMKGWQEECDIEREKYSQERVVEMSEAVMGSKVISSSRLVATSIVALALLGLHILLESLRIYNTARDLTRWEARNIMDLRSMVTLWCRRSEE